MTPVEVGKVAAFIRIDNDGDNHDTRIEVHLGHLRALLPQGIARALATMLGERLVLAEKIDAQHEERHGPRPLPEYRYRSDLTIRLDVTHDVDRHELVQVVAARLATIVEREGGEVHGLDLDAKHNAAETGPLDPNPPHDD